jgi:capsular exopolysaccharide synthesis family protein
LNREPGLTDHFVRHEPLDALLRPTRTANLFALTAGTLPPNPPALLTRKDMARFFDELRARFEWILLDSPPLASVTDALLLARYADLSVMVVRHNAIDKRLVKRSVNSLRKATPTLLGIVLNAVDVKTKGYYYYYHYEGTETGRPERARPKPVAAVGKK